MRRQNQGRAVWAPCGFDQMPHLWRQTPISELDAHRLHGCLLLVIQQAGSGSGIAVVQHQPVRVSVEGECLLLGTQAKKRKVARLQ